MNRSILRYNCPVVLTVLLILSCFRFPLSAKADAADSKERYIEKEVTITCVLNHKKLEGSESYSDTYFETDEVSENIELLKASALAAASTYGNAADQFLVDAGFGSVEHHYTGKGKHSTVIDNDHCTVYSGSKHVSDDSRIIAAVISGYSAGDYEWISNFNLGKGQTHAGFEAASQEVIAYLDHTYSFQNGDILWITGHSRGAAVTNLVARHYIDQSICKVFAYGFATPNVALSDQCSGTERIVNILNSGDFVPCIPLSTDFDGWMYAKNGILTFFDVNDEIIEKYRKYSGRSSFKGYTMEKRDAIVNTFNEACNSTKEGYFLPRSDKEKKQFTPQHYMEYGLGMVMTDSILRKAAGAELMARYSELDSVYYKLTACFVKDGKLHEKIEDAHRAEIYLAYADSLVK